MPRSASLTRCLVLAFVFFAGATHSAQTEPFDAYLKRTFAPIPAAAVAVVKGDQIVFEAGYGHTDAQKKVPVDVHTRFELASVTKQLTAMAVMMQKEAGRFQYDSPITEFFPEFRGFAQGVTVRNLLQHSAGFPDYMELCRRAPSRNSDVVALMVAKGKLDFKPGERHMYSNTGYSLLAVLVERTSELSFPDFMEQKIFAPLGMKNSFVNRWGIPPLPNVARSFTNASNPAESPDVVNCNTVYGDGSVFSTAHDMALWNRYLESNTVVGTKAPMDEAYQTVKAGNRTWPYGFGWGLGDRSGLKQYAHGGAWAGYRTLNVRLPEKQVSVVVLTNGQGPDLEAVVSRAFDTYLR